MKIIGIDDDNKVNRKLNRKKIFLTVVVSALILFIIIVISLYVANRDVREFIDIYVLRKTVLENNLDYISIDESETNYIYAYDKYITILNNNTLTNYNSSGKKEGEVSVEINNPIIDTSGKYLLMGEKDKQKLYLISGNNIIWETKVEGNIFRVAVNKNGYVAVILSGTTYKSVIEIYDNNGKKLFKTYISYSTAMDVDISQDNKYVSFAEISTEGTQIKSTIKTISIEKARQTQSESIINTYVADMGDLILNIKYQDGNRLLCRYDNKIQVINNDKVSDITTFKEDGKKINIADIELANHSYRVVEKSGFLKTETTVEIFNTSNKNVSSYILDGTIKDMYSYNNCFAINIGSEVHFIGTNGWLIKKYTSSQEVRSIVICNNFAGIVYRNKIEIVNL